VLAQCLRAAAATVPAGRELHSQHAYFLRPGDPSQPLQLLVERTRDGASFSARRVQAAQRGKPILNCGLSFQQPGAGEVWQPRPLPVPLPESLVTERERTQAIGDFDPELTITNGLDLDVRCVDPLLPGAAGRGRSSMQVWFRATGSLGTELSLHQAVIAYLSDAFLLDICLSSAGLDYRDPGVQCASLDHALWFHAACRADTWLLHEVETGWLGGGRGLARGRFFTAAGQLVASCQQEVLMRRRGTT